METVITVECSSCHKEFLFAGKIEHVPDGICLDCFVEKYGVEEAEAEGRHEPAR